MSLIESWDILTKLCSNDYYRGDDVQCAIQCLAEGKTIKRVRTLEDVGMTVIDEKLKDELMKAKDGKGAFDDVNPKWLSLLLTFLSTDPPRREITVRAEIGGKSVNISYDPHDPEAVKAAETWRNALFAVKDGDGVTFAEPQKFDLDGFLKRIQREGYCCPSGSFGEKPAETVKRGHWEKSDIPNEEYVCSVCGGACWYYGYNGRLGKSRYCPNCGARMENVT